METKKTQKADLNSKKGLFFSGGLVVTLALALMAFEIKTYDEKISLDQGPRTNTVDETIDVPLTVQPPPMQPIIPTPVIIETPNDEEIQEEVNINFDAEVNEETEIEPVPVIAEIPEEKVTDLPFDVVEEPAEPKNGFNGFYKWIAEKMNGKYPAQARKMGVEGKVYLNFIIAKDGSISDVKVTKGIGAGCDELATKIMQGAPAWKPGLQRGKAVKSRFTLPITFRLG
jgi:periplasmic protein TonB